MYFNFYVPEVAPTIEKMHENRTIQMMENKLVSHHFPILVKFQK